MKTNVPVKHESVRTHEGGKAQREPALKELRRTLSTCLLFENTFYESGADIATRLGEQAKTVSMGDLIAETIRAKEDMKLRHAPLWMAVHLTSLHQGKEVGDAIERVVKRADELAEFLSLYWKRNGKDAPLTKQMKLGLGKAFDKFDQYQFSKWDREGEVKLRDVMFLVHPKPSKDREELYRLIADDNLPPPMTWEVLLSAARTEQERHDAWTNLLAENRLGALALIRNLRNMEKDTVDRIQIINALDRAKVGGILPYQFVAAWKNAPAFSKAIDALAQRALKTAKKLTGTTILIVDVSSSMEATLSSKSDMSRIMAAGALASHLVGVCDDVRIFTFSNSVIEVQAIPGFGILDAISDSQGHSSTYLARAVEHLIPVTIGADRVIVITDEQAQDSGVRRTQAKRDYMVNVAPYKYGVAVERGWIKISGFSPAVVDWIVEEESNPLFED